MNQSPRPVWQKNAAPFGVTLWLVICASASVGGWLLSALRQLDVRGYSCLMVFLVMAIVLWQKSRHFSDVKSLPLSCHRLLRRFRKPLPLGFLIMAAVALVGGLIYAPVNYDALAYRVPRVLHWLADGQWHWIHTDFPRLNVRACGAEWLMAPLIAFSKNSRWIFLSNVISFLLLPGLLFSVLTRLGAKRKTAWHWMWIIPAGHCFVMQAGGIANDLPGAVYALAAFDFGLRLRASQRPRDAWLFLIAAALLTGAKASNLPLLLPAFILIVPHLRLLLVRPVASAAVTVFAVMSSFVPTAVLNWKYCHDWSGMSLEGPMQGPFTQLAINTGNWILLNFAPPIFPFAGPWARLLARIFPHSVNAVRCLTVPAFSLDEGDALGMGVCLLLLASWLAGRALRKPAAANRPAKPLTLYWKIFFWSPWIALLAFGLKAQAVFSSSRLLTPYYAILLAPVLVFYFDERLLRRRWWKCAVAAVFVLAISLEILMPARPLWPARSILTSLKASHPRSALIAQAESVYTVYGQRAESFAPLVAELPADANVFGLVTFDYPEAALWWPLGSRRIEHVTLDDTPKTLVARGIKYILAPAFCYAVTLPVADVIKKYDAKVIKVVPIKLHPRYDAEDWYILEIGGGSAPPP